MDSLRLLRAPIAGSGQLNMAVRLIGECANFCVSTEGFTPRRYAHFVLNSTSLQLIAAYSSQINSPGGGIR